MTEIPKYRYPKTNFFIILSRHFLYIVILIILTGINPSIVFLYAQEPSDPVLPDKRIQPPFVNDLHYNKVLSDAMILQNMADSLEERAFQYRQEIMYMDNVSERNKLQFQLGILEENVQSVEAEADSLFDILSGITGTDDEQTSLLILDTVIEGIKVYHYNTEEITDGSKQINNSVAEQKMLKENPSAAGGSDNVFSILPRPAYSSDHPFEYDFQIPEGVFYRIQLAAVSQEIGWNQFGGIQPVTVENAGDGKFTKYFAGKFSDYSDAESALIRVRSAGFKDAFIVSYYNGHRMSVEQVREFEKSEH
jgi:hypothetical protein